MAGTPGSSSYPTANPVRTAIAGATTSVGGSVSCGSHCHSRTVSASVCGSADGITVRPDDDGPAVSMSSADPHCRLRQ